MNLPGSADSSSIRLFVGIACPPSTTIAAFLDELRVSAPADHPAMRIVAPENLHITLKFLGAVASTSTGPITEALDQIATETSPFTITLEGAGIFTDVFWLGVGPCEPLNKLAETVDRRLEYLGFQPEKRPFIPHLTIARMNERARSKIDSLLQQWRNEVWSNLRVQRIHLYQSKTQPAGVRYEVLHTAEFPDTPGLKKSQL